VLDELKHILGSPYSTVTGGNEMRYCCPYCSKRGRGADIHHHLYLNKSSGLFFCQRCEAKGHVSFFLKGSKNEPSYGRSEDGKRRSRIDALHTYFRNRMSRLPAEYVEEPATASLPDDYIPVMNWPSSEAVEYLDGRGIPFDLAMQRGIGFGATKNRGRIIFPVFEPGNKTKCIYWVARSYTNVDHEKECECYLCKYKYTNAPKVQRRHFIYGLEFCDDSGECCITEGSISALCSGQNAVATLGKYVTDEQLDLLSDRFDKIQVALDPDAYKGSVNLMRRILGRGKIAEWIPLPSKKDPADLGTKRMVHLRKKEAIPVTRSMLSRVLLSGVNELE
jgi:hypothetical protein